MSSDIINCHWAWSFPGKHAKEAREYDVCDSVASSLRQPKRPRAVIYKSPKAGEKQLVKAREAAGRELWRQMLEHHRTICNLTKIMALNYLSLALVH